MQGCNRRPGSSGDEGMFSGGRQPARGELPPYYCTGVLRVCTRKNQHGEPAARRQAPCFRRNPPRGARVPPLRHQGAYRCGKFCIWSARAGRARVPPRWGDDPAAGAEPVICSAAREGVRGRCLFGSCGGAGKGYGGAAPMQTREGEREGGLFAQEGPQSGAGGPRALQTKPRAQNRSGRRSNRRCWGLERGRRR